MKFNKKTKYSRSIICTTACFALLALDPGILQGSGFFGSVGAAHAQGVGGNLPMCPPLINGEPEYQSPDGLPWQAGVNCLLESSSGAPAVGAPRNTLGTGYSATVLINATPF